MKLANFIIHKLCNSLFHFSIKTEDLSGNTFKMGTQILLNTTKYVQILSQASRLDSERKGEKYHHETTIIYNARYKSMYRKMKNRSDFKSFQ